MAADATDLVSRFFAGPSTERSDHVSFDLLRRNLKCWFIRRKHAEEAEDLAQEVLLRLERALKGGLHPELDSAVAKARFAFGIAAKVHLETLRDGYGKTVGIDEQSTALHTVKPVDLISKDCLKLIRKAVEENLARLGPKQREVIRGTYLNPDGDVSFAVFARKVGVSEASVRQRVVQARRNLEALLQESPDWAAIRGCREGGYTG